VRRGKAEVFCDFQIQHQAPDEPVQLGDPGLPLAVVPLAGEDVGHAAEDSLLPEGDQLGLEAVPAAEVGLSLGAGEDGQDDFGLELRVEGTARFLAQPKALRRDQYSLSY
jgi:hypothetical protein